MGRRWEAEKTDRKRWQVDARLRTSDMDAQDWKTSRTSSFAMSSKSMMES